MMTQKIFALLMVIMLLLSMSAVAEESVKSTILVMPKIQFTTVESSNGSVMMMLGSGSPQILNVKINNDTVVDGMSLTEKTPTLTIALVEVGGNQYYQLQSGTANTVDFTIENLSIGGDVVSGEGESATTVTYTSTIYVTAGLVEQGEGYPGAYSGITAGLSKVSAEILTGQSDTISLTYAQPVETSWPYVAGQEVEDFAGIIRDAQNGLKAKVQFNISLIPVETP